MKSRPGNFLSRWSRRQASSGEDASQEPGVERHTSPTFHADRHPDDCSQPLSPSDLHAIFRAPEFAERDGLDDYDGDYTFFEPRGDLLTCDMRWAEERTRDPSPERICAGESPVDQDNVPPAAELTPLACDPSARHETKDHCIHRPLMPESPVHAARRSADSYTSEPTRMVSYSSEGRLLIIGDACQVTGILDRVHEPLQPYLLLTDAIASAPELPAMLSHPPTYGSAIRIAGHLGAFRIEAQQAGREFDVGPPLAGEPTFDLVLDLQADPAIPAPIAPLGYFAPRGDAEQTLQALDALAELVGVFDKPKFFEYRPDLCAHGARGIEGCRLCLDSCLTLAIRSEGEKVSVDPYLCQGCGDCALVCPSGAMSYLYPRRRDTLNQLRSMLKAFFDAGGREPIVLFHESGSRGIDLASLSDRVLTFELEALGSAGMDIWLSALAYGATRVGLLFADSVRTETRDHLLQQLRYASEIVSGMGYPADMMQSLQAAEIAQLFVAAATSLRPPASFAGIEDKRTVIRLAVEHLHQYAPRAQDSVKLSLGAPFGNILVDRDRCTLCLSCVSVCPQSALVDGKDLPQLKLIEANCVQCGLCQRACPESAIELEPRYLLDQKTARESRLLHEEAIFRCVECGKPFATLSMIETITARLDSHYMFQGENKRRLRMCEDCKVKRLFG